MTVGQSNSWQVLCLCIACNAVGFAIGYCFGYNHGLFRAKVKLGLLILDGKDEQLKKILREALSK